MTIAPCPENYDMDTTLAPQPTSNVVFVTDATSAQGASETPSSPLDVTMLAMLGLTMAGAGVMKSQSAQKKQQELAQANAIAQAQLTTVKADQAQIASANWEQNQTMQANATQKVYTQVQQSQANIDFWASYAAWKIKVAEAEEKRRQAELEARIKAYYAALRLRPVSSQSAQPLQPSWATLFTRARAMQINRRNNASQSGAGSSANGGGAGSSETSKPISGSGNAKMAGTNNSNPLTKNKGDGFLGLVTMGNVTTNMGGGFGISQQDDENCDDNISPFSNLFNTFANFCSITSVPSGEYVARNTTVTINSFNRTPVRNVSLGTIAIYNNQEVLVTHDHFDRSRPNQCQSLFSLQRVDYIYVEGVSGGNFIPTSDLQTSCVPYEGVNIFSRVSGLPFGTTPFGADIIFRSTATTGENVYFPYIPGWNDEAWFPSDYNVIPTQYGHIQPYSAIEIEHRNTNNGINVYRGPASAGDSGAGLFDTHGRLIGVLQETPVSNDIFIIAEAVIIQFLGEGVDKVSQRDHIFYTIPRPIP